MENVNRRTFLQTTGMAAAVAMTAAHSSGADAPASERIRAGFVGVGGRAGALLSMFSARPDVEVVALAEVDSRRLPQALETVRSASDRKPTTHTDFRKLVDDKSIDVLVVGTPDHWHAIPTILGCLAGKDVYVEKPDGHNMVEGQRMVAAARKEKRIVQLGTQSRTSAHFQTAMEFIRSGKLGKVLVAKAWESARQGAITEVPDGNPPEGVDYDTWLGAAPKRPFNERRFHGNWRWFFDYGTGDLGNDGVHRLDVARWALSTAIEAQGESPLGLPSKISALGGKWFFDDVQEWPDTLQVTYEFAGGAGKPGRLLTYEMRLWAPYTYHDETEGVVLYGDQGLIIIGNQRWRAFGPKHEPLANGQGNNDGDTHIENFIQCVKSRQRPNADLETVGHPSSVLCHAGNIAWRVGRQLTLDPTTETFVNDSEANTLRTRPEYRKPWLLPEV